MHGRFKHDVKIGEKDELIVNGHKIKCIQASREGPKALPWKDSYLLIFIYFLLRLHFHLQSWNRMNFVFFADDEGHGRGICDRIHGSLRRG